MDKSPDAFRTISEVAEVLDTPAHVLRFWESRFPQIRPVKRAGGRRYYRPADVALLTGIKHLLHDEGLTIRGVQKILREQGVRHVSALSGHEVTDEGDDAEAALEAALSANFGGQSAEPAPQAEVETAQVVALESALRARDADAEAVPSESTGPAEVLPLFDFAEKGTPVAKKADPTAEAALWVDPELEDSFQSVDLHARSSDKPGSPPQAPIVSGSLLDRLRALPAGSLAHDTKAAALRDRLAALAARLSVSPPQAPL